MKKGLGRGLEALLGDQIIDSISENSSKQSLNNNTENKKTTDNSQSQQFINIDFLTADPLQPRKNFDQDLLRELSLSIKQFGLLQPILVTKKSFDNYQIIAGERRFRAAQLIGLKSVPIIEKKLNEEEIAQIALIENLQRVDLNSLEEALAYNDLKNKYGYSPEYIGNKIGKSRSYITNMMRLLQLPDSVKSLLKQDKISMGHARALIGSDNAEMLATIAVKDSLSVRAIEKLVKKSIKQNSNKKNSQPDGHYLDYAEQIATELGLMVEITKAKKGGVIKITYLTVEQLNLVGKRLLQHE